jgi:TonB family protein
MQGEVKVEVTLTGDGSVQSAKATGPDEVLNRAAEENVRQWTFSPLGIGEIGTKLFVAYEYKLVGDADDAPTTVVFDLPDRVEITAHPAKVIDAYPAQEGKLPR